MMGTLLNKQLPKTVRLLIVEDEYILAINLQETLESLGYTVLDIADTGEAAIERATELRPNLILMDIRLRGEMDGIQAAENIWNDLQIPVIYVTGHSDKCTVERATLTSPFGYILKPINEQELYVSIETALNRYEREQFLSSVLRGMGDGVIVVDSQLRVKYLNQVAEALTGWQWDEVNNQVLTNVFKLIDEQTQLPVENPLILAIQQKTTIYLNSRTLLITKNGTTIPVADSATPLRDYSGVITGAVLVFRDDTQRRLIEECYLAAERSRQLEIQMAELQKLNKLKEDFLATTSHEMRSPLSNIKMAIMMLEDVMERQGILISEPSSESESLAHHLSILRKECERGLDLVDDLLNMRIIDADAYPLELNSIILQDWIPLVAESFQARFQAKRQILKVSVSPNLPPVVSDFSLLNRIVSELLNNAYRYTPPFEEIAVSAKLIYTTKSLINEDTSSDIFNNPQVPLLQITVSNSGVEIPITEQSRIFEPFYRIPNNESSPPDDGAGLGLALVRKLVLYLQGRIEVASSQGWTCFTIQLPLILSENRGEGEPYN